ncbi:Cla4p [Rhizophagus irregularis DAOM 197198w]|uniref:Cla4p n=1 Tax=Rhizophagus irregularis (strain DAOM 197198w) TaxID=1432141 RepID=A0A015J3Q8_RHIIW|nr:Cla4p [Rhizophagus irregularis DAOM 197198w]
MSTIQRESVYAAINNANMSIDYNVHDDIHKQNKFMVETIIVDNSLTDDEKTEAIKILNIDYDRNKVRNNEGTRRICENCNQECLATLYCEFCFRNYLKLKFSNWTSGNDNIDNLIQKCQMETYVPYKIIEWIPYDNLKDIKYLTKGGFSEIYTAIWIDGEYEEWNSKEKRLTRCGSMDVVLKSLENVESANQSWFEEVCNLNYTNIFKIKQENAIHRDLHSGNILYSEINDSWYISDLGFCGPADKPTKSIYGNLPYIAPEVIAGREYTLASDIYSVAMLMWEISSGQPPFINYENDYYLATNIINGIRPRIVSEIPLEYKSLMEQCWNANLSERLDTQTLFDKMSEIHLLCQNRPDELIQSKTKKYSGINEINSNYTGSRLFKSKVHQFENFPEPKNATEGNIYLLNFALFIF